ncbi:MAG: hypothetical protein ACRC9L_06400 [Brevinema sp.]
MYLFLLLTVVVSTASFAQKRPDINSGPTSIVFLPSEKAPKEAPGLEGVDIRVAGLSQPASVTVRKGMLYVANMGKGKGFITVSDTNGAGSKKISQDLLSNPRGIGFFSDSLMLVTDNPHLKVIDPQNSRVVAEVAVPGAGLLDDVAIINSTTAFVSDSAKGSIYLVRLSGSSLTATPITGLDGTVAGVDSLYYTNSKLYLVTSQKVNPAASGSIHTATLNRDMTSATLSPALTDSPIGGGHLSGIYVKGPKILVGDYANGRKGKANFYAFEESSKRQIMSTGGRTALGDFGMSEDEWLYIPEISGNKIIRLHNPI